MMNSKDDFVKIKQINTQKAKTCHSFICNEMYTEKSIFLIQEPYVYKGEIYANTYKVMIFLGKKMHEQL